MIEITFHPHLISLYMREAWWWIYLRTHAHVHTIYFYGILIMVWIISCRKKRKQISEIEKNVCFFVRMRCFWKYVLSEIDITFCRSLNQWQWLACIPDTTKSHTIGQLAKQGMTNSLAIHACPTTNDHKMYPSRLSVLCMNIEQLDCRRQTYQLWPSWVTQPKRFVLALRADKMLFQLGHAMQVPSINR